VLYSPDGTRLAAGSADGLVRVWDAQSGELQNTLSGHAGFSLVLSFSQDGTRLYTDSNDYTIKEWDLSPGHELLTLPGRIGSAPFSPDGTKLALTAADGSLSVVDSHTGDVLLSWQAHSDWIEDIAWGPDDKLIATSSGNDLLWGSRNDHTAKIWEAATGQLLKELPGDEYLGFSQVAWSPDSSRLVTASMERGISLIWDRSSGELIRTTPEQDLILALAYSPDGQKIAVTSYTDLIIWDAITGNEVFRQTLGHNALGLAFSPDGQRLATGLSDGEILFFKNTGVGMVEEPGFSNGDKFVLTLAFSPDGALLASGDNTGKVRVWDLKTGQMRLEMTTFTDPVTRVAFSPDNQRLVASSLAGLTYFYVLPVDELTELARSRIITPMTPEQCREYLHTETCPAWP
jgi:WD40 repeat protein